MRNIPRQPLDQALAYQADPILDRFMGAYDVEESEAELFFLETKKWLWLCATAYADREMGRIRFRLVIDDYLIFIDEMWHNFILFTKEYQHYCDSYLGIFVHHNPTPPRLRKDQHNRIQESDTAYEQLIESRRRQYEYIYDKLGEETLTSWYGEYGILFNRAWFSKRRAVGS